LTTERESHNLEHPLEGGQTDAVHEVQATGAQTLPDGMSFLIRFPDGVETLENVDDNGSFPKRGDEVAPGWIVDQVEVRDGRDEDITIHGEPVYAEVTVVTRDDFVA
jgi:hypothetical protein